MHLVSLETIDVIDKKLDTGEIDYEEAGVLLDLVEKLGELPKPPHEESKDAIVINIGQLALF